MTVSPVQMGEACLRSSLFQNDPGHTSPASVRQIDDSRCLNGQNQRHTHHKIPMAGLMMKQIHTGPSPDTAAQQGGAEQRALRDAPLARAGAVFINPHQAKGQRIYYHTIYQCSIHSSIIRALTAKRKT